MAKKLDMGLTCQVLKQMSRSALEEALQLISGPKDLVLDKDLVKPLDRIAGARYLKSQGIDKIYLLDESCPTVISSIRVFIIRANVAAARKVANQINASTDNGAKNIKHKLLMVPRKLHVCERVLEQEGVIGHLDVAGLDLGFIPLEEDVLSLDIPDFYRSFFLERDSIWIYSIANSLFDIQSLFGTIRHVYCFGKASQMTYETYNMLLQEKLGGKVKHDDSEIEYLFLIDRDIDYSSVLLNPGTYEGLLDEIFGIKYGYLELNKQITGSEQNVKLLLDKNDKVFENVRNRHFSDVFSYLSETAKQLKSSHQERKNMTVEEMRSFVSNELKIVQQEKQSLAMHIAVCEAIVQKKSKDFKEQLQIENSIVDGYDFQASVSFIEEMLMKQVPVSQVLRLLCLLSYTNDGLEVKTHNSLKTQFIQSYGHEHFITFHMLRQTGLFVDYESKNLVGKMVSPLVSLPRVSSFRTAVKKFNLIPKKSSNSGTNNLNDIGYVFSGAYIPLATSIVKQVLENNGIYVIEEAMKLLQAPCISKSLSSSARFHVRDQARKTIILYFLGGVTYAEIAAFRRLSQLKECNIVILSTSLINGNNFIDVFMNDALSSREKSGA